MFLAQLETPLDAIDALFRRPQARAGATILNAAPEGQAPFTLADILVVNQGELAFYAGTRAPRGAVEAAPLARRLISRPGQSVVDATGAGDCFCGVLAGALDEGLAPVDAAIWANAAAAVSIERPGAAVSPSLRAAVEGGAGALGGSQTTG